MRKFKEWLRLRELANGVSTYDIKVPSPDRRPDLKTGGTVPEPKNPMTPDPVTSAFPTYSLPPKKKLRNHSQQSSGQPLVGGSATNNLP